MKMMTASATTAPPPKMDNKRSQACSWLLLNRNGPARAAVSLHQEAGTPTEIAATWCAPIFPRCFKRTQLRPAAPIFIACCVSVSVNSISHYGRVIAPCTTSQAATGCPTTYPGCPRLHWPLWRRRGAQGYGVDARAISGARADAAVLAVSNLRAEVPYDRQQHWCSHRRPGGHCGRCSPAQRRRVFRENDDQGRRRSAAGGVAAIARIAHIK